MESLLRLPAGHCRRQFPCQVTRRASWETESREAAAGILSGEFSESYADPQAVSRPDNPFKGSTSPLQSEETLQLGPFNS